MNKAQLTLHLCLSIFQKCPRNIQYIITKFYVCSTILKHWEKISLPSPEDKHLNHYQ